MSTKLSAGKASRSGDSNAQFLGTKKYGGEKVQNGNILIRQRGANILAGKNVRLGKDYTAYSITSGTVTFTRTRKVKFNGKVETKKVINVI